LNHAPHPIRSATALVLLLLLLGSLPVQAAERELVDFAGRRVTLPSEPQRVISLAPAITELVFALGRHDVLKGVTQFSDFPPEARELPLVGSYHRPDIERIVALRPDLVLAIRDGNPIQAVTRIEAMGIPVFAVDPRSLAEIMQTITVLGEILNARAQAQELVSTMAGRIDVVRQTVSVASSRPSVFFQVDAAPLVSVGEDTFLHEMIEMAGGRNATAGKAPWPRVGWEEILRLQPDVVVISSMAGGQAPEELLREWRRWPQLQAVQSGRIHVEDADLFNRPTHRLVSGLELMARRIHPELFAEGR
jgi:iron complex transport system substrate-binding protein